MSDELRPVAYVSADASLPTDPQDKVRFAPPRGRARMGWRLWFNSVYFAILGIWAVAGSWDRQRVLGIVAALVYLELMLATARIASLSGAVVYDQSTANRIAVPLIELCRVARCLVPSVVIRDDTIRAAAVRRGRKGRVLLVVSQPFVDRVDDRQLRALLAHEVVHVAQNDLASARRRGWASAVAVGVAWVAIAVTANKVVIFPVLLTIGLVTGILASVALSTLNRRLEWRADTEGAKLCEDPAGLASALAVVHTFSAEARRRVFGPMPWRWILSPLSWRPPTHPPMARRIARLERTDITLRQNTSPS